MARIRTIKPEFWTSEKVVECSPVTRLLFIGMWNFADDYGVQPAKIRTLKMQVFPGDSFTVDQISEMVQELIAQHLIEEYSIDGEKYWLISGFSEHQRIDQKTGRYPLPSGAVGGKERRRDVGEPAPQKDETKSEETNRRQVFKWGNQNLESLKSMAANASFSGSVKDEMEKFCAHYSQNLEFSSDPVLFFLSKFTAWLITCRERQTKNHKTAPTKLPQKKQQNQVNRESIEHMLKTAFGSIQWQERHVSALIQMPDMTTARERAAELSKQLLNTNSARSGPMQIGSAMAGKMQ